MRTALIAVYLIVAGFTMLRTTSDPSWVCEPAVARIGMPLMWPILVGVDATWEALGFDHGLPGDCPDGAPS